MRMGASRQRIGLNLLPDCKMRFRVGLRNSETTRTMDLASVQFLCIEHARVSGHIDAI